MFTRQAALLVHLLDLNRPASLEKMLEEVWVTQSAGLLLRLCDPSYSHGWEETQAGGRYWTLASFALCSGHLD